MTNDNKTYTWDDVKVGDVVRYPDGECRRVVNIERTDKGALRAIMFYRSYEPKERDDD